MSDSTAQDENGTGEESERIRKWREERARVAAEEKEKRIAQAKEEAARKAEADAVARREAARDLLPSQTDLAQIHATMRKRARSLKRQFFLQVLLVVVLPVAFVAWYMGTVATPLYEARSVIAISKPNAEGQQNLGGLMGLAGSSNLDEVFMAHEFVQSDALANYLESEIQLVTRLSGPVMDPLRRLRDLSLTRVTKRASLGAFVDSATNIQTSLMTLFVRLPDPQEAEEVSRLILDRTAQQINMLTGDVFDERIAGAQAAVANAEEALTRAQSDLVDVQIEGGEANPRMRIEGIYETIRALEVEAQALDSEIERTEIQRGAEGFVATRQREMRSLLEERIAEQRALLITSDDREDASLNALLMRFELAGLRVRIAEETLTAALQSLSEARNAAALGRSIFQVVVPPSAGSTPVRPDLPSTLLITLMICLALLAVLRMIIGTRQTSVD